MKLKHGSLFSGIGGFDLAAEWMGWNNIFHCEIDPFCQKVLKHHFPNSEQLTDIKTIDFTKYANKIDILTGGFPCQPFSVSGKRNGTDDERYLWPEMLRAIREIKPQFIVGENVYGLFNWSGGLVFEQVQIDLENEGYEVQAVILPACGKNAPHRRDRIWFIANSFSDGHWGKNRPKENSSSAGENNCKENKRKWFRNDFNGNGSEKLTSDTYKFGLSESGKPYGQLRNKKEKNGQASWTKPNDTWPTQSPLRNRNDGISNKLANRALKGLGNAIVPQIAFEIFKAIELTI